MIELMAMSHSTELVSLSSGLHLVSLPTPIPQLSGKERP